MADIVIWKSEKDKLENNSPSIVVECKAEHITIHEEDYFQGYNYASWAGADFFVTTDDRLLKNLRRQGMHNAYLPTDALAILENWYEN